MRSWIGKAWQWIGNGMLAIPLAAGWLAGRLAKTARLAWAALVEGYHLGNKL